ncbi:MAG: hypothetical protein ACI4YB_08195 [Oscillospiraceae bacterium]
MYDFIAVTDSNEKTEVVFAYSEPKENIRKETFLYEKAYKAYRVIRITTSGTEKSENISATEFNWNYGTAVGQMAKNIG